MFCEGRPLKNTFNFASLGHAVEADGNCEHAVKVRMAKAGRRFGELRLLWKDKSLPLKLKLQLYHRGVISVLVYGFQAWKFTDRVVSMLKGFNARCLYKLTGRTVAQESRSPSFDLIKTLRARRLRWVGHVLRLDNSYLSRRVLVEVSKAKPYPRGSILEDAPPHDSVADLVDQALNRGAWSKLVGLLEK